MAGEIVSKVVAFASARGRRKTRRAARMEIVAQIIEALEKLGGSAHRDVVVDQIARDRQLLDLTEIELLRASVTEVFEAHSEPRESEPETPPIFRRVYGPNSRRWGFSRKMQAQLRAGDTVDLEQMTL